MVIHEIDGIKFRLKEFHDFAWVKKYGTVFSAIDGTGSGCICFGTQVGSDRYFVKIAGVDTVDAEITPEESVQTLKQAAKLYQTLKHPALVELIEHGSYRNYYVAVFQWAEGECLFDHWNFAEYDGASGKISPGTRFRNLPAEQKLVAVDSIFSFLETVVANSYVAVDFYDGSLIYDFQTDKMTICDIDLFQKQPAVNDMGENYWGTQRLKAPEEYILGAAIDERTNVFTLGALIFDFFGEYTQREIKSRYENHRFLPCSIEKWTLNSESYFAALQAVDFDRTKRYKTISEFHKAFQGAIKHQQTF